MFTKLHHWWQKMWSSFWFVPAVMVLDAVLLAAILITVDATVDLTSFSRTQRGSNGYLRVDLGV